SCARRPSAPRGQGGRAGNRSTRGKFLPMRLLLLLSALLTTIGSAHAADWHVLPDTARRAGAQTRNAPEATAVPRIINGVFTAAYPAVARLTIWTEDSVGLFTRTLVAPSTILTAAHCVADGPVEIDA